MNTSYFKQAFSILLLATLFFLGLKSYLPARIFPEDTRPSANVVVDSLMLEALAGKDIEEVISKPTDSSATAVETGSAQAFLWIH